MAHLLPLPTLPPIPPFLYPPAHTPAPLQAAYGDEAFRWMTPLTFALPEELPEWQQWLRNHPGSDPALWMLKTGQDAGEEWWRALRRV